MSTADELLDAVEEMVLAGWCFQRDERGHLWAQSPEDDRQHGPFGGMRGAINYYLMHKDDKP